MTALVVVFIVIPGEKTFALGVRVTFVIIFTIGRIESV